jgi:class 3 adenylate cyclase/TolB-like protein/Tfp pilus assembly protein PilF
MSQRRLAAIMFTDLMGYTSLTEKNEPAALELVKKNRDLHQQAIQKYNGQLVKELGDGFMATFDNVLDAISCAREIQIEAKARNFDIPVRIGLHYGDITIENDDIFGHGVNMASRIQAIADPGGVYISESIHEMIDGREDIETQFMGAVPLKNIKDPVPVYALKDEKLPRPDKKRIDGIIRRHLYLKYYRYAAVAAVLIIAVAAIWFLRTFNIERDIINKSVAVLPLENLSEDPEQEYLSTGMTEELIRELSKVETLTIIAQSSTRQYAGIVKPFSEIAQELNDVNYIVNGNVLLEGEKIKTEIRLINPVEENIIWKQEYQQEVTNSRQLWAKVAEDIVDIIGVFVPEENTALWTGIQPVDQENYALYLKGMHAIDKRPQDLDLAISYFNQAIDKNPADAYAWAGLANAYIYYGHSTTATRDVRQQANAAALRAIQLDSTLALAWSVLGMVKAYYEWEWEAAEQAYHKANELNPSLPWNHYHYAWYLALFGRMNEAIHEHKLAQELDPFGFAHTRWLAALYMGVGEYEKAIKEAERTIEMGYEAIGRSIIANCYFQMGREKEAIEMHEQLVADFGVSKGNLAGCYLRAGRIEEARQIFEEFLTNIDSIPSPGEALGMATVYRALGDYDNAFKWFNFEPHMHFVPWNVRGNDDSLFVKDPRFKALLRKMNLPDPAPPQYDPDLEL